MNFEPSKSFQPDSTEEIAPGLFCDWYQDRQLVAYRLLQVSQPAIQAWADFVVKVLTDWDAGKPYLALHDLSQPGVSLQYATLVGFDTMNLGITNMGREQAEHIVDTADGLYVRVAMNFNLSVSGHMNKVLADNRQRSHPFIEYRTFYNREKALEWLNKLLPGQESESS